MVRNHLSPVITTYEWFIMEECLLSNNGDNWFLMVYIEIPKNDDHWRYPRGLETSILKSMQSVNMSASCHPPPCPALPQAKPMWRPRQHPAPRRKKRDAWQRLLDWCLGWERRKGYINSLCMCMYRYGCRCRYRCGYM